MKRITCLAAVIAAFVTVVACGPRQEPAPAGTTPQTPAPAPGAAPAQPAGAPSAAPAPAPGGETGQAPTGAPAATAPAPAPSAAPGAPAPPAAPAPEPEPPQPQYQEVTIPAGTSLSIVLDTEVASATSKVEDPVRGHLGRAVTIKGVEALPRGSRVSGVVTDAKASAKVKGLASVAFRFTDVRVGDEVQRIHTSAVARQAKSTKGKDAKKIGIGAGAGALVGAIAGGGKGAAIGAGVGGGVGTGVVLATKGQEVTVPAGSTVTASLTEPLTVRVLVQK
jgi:hypothetical protein